MHRFTPPGSFFAFIHNGDYSGDVEIVDYRNNTKMTIPVPDLMSFVAENVRHQKIEELESMSVRELLLGDKK